MCAECGHIFHAFARPVSLSSAREKIGKRNYKLFIKPLPENFNLSNALIYSLINLHIFGRFTETVKRAYFNAKNPSIGFFASSAFSDNILFVYNIHVYSLYYVRHFCSFSVNKINNFFTVSGCINITLSEMTDDIAIVM